MEAANIITGSNNNKVMVCQKAPGQPNQFVEIEIGLNALQAHLGHGDCVGPCKSQSRIRNEKVTPSGFMLTVFPNPLKDQANISFMFPEQDYVTLNLYGHMGQKVKTLYANEVQGEKQYNLDVTTEDLPSGLYFLKMEGTKYHRILKLMIIK